MIGFQKQNERKMKLKKKLKLTYFMINSLR